MYTIYNSLSVQYFRKPFIERKSRKILIPQNYSTPAVAANDQENICIKGLTTKTSANEAAPAGGTKKPKTIQIEFRNFVETLDSALPMILNPRVRVYTYTHTLDHLSRSLPWPDTRASLR